MKITDIRRASDEEVPEHWRHRRGPSPVVLVLETGDIILPAHDPELNGPGHLLGYDGEGFFDVRPEAGQE